MMQPPAAHAPAKRMRRAIPEVDDLFAAQKALVKAMNHLRDADPKDEAARRANERVEGAYRRLRDWLARHGNDGVGVEMPVYQFKCQQCGHTGDWEMTFDEVTESPMLPCACAGVDDAGVAPSTPHRRIYGFGLGPGQGCRRKSGGASEDPRSVDEAICRLCGMMREEIPESTLRKNLPAYLCLLCDCNIKPDRKRATARP